MGRSTKERGGGQSIWNLYQPHWLCFRSLYSLFAWTPTCQSAETTLIQKGWLPETEKILCWEGKLHMARPIILARRRNCQNLLNQKYQSGKQPLKKKSFFFFFFKCWLFSDSQSFLVRLQLEMPLWVRLCVSSVAQSCLTLCNVMDYSLQVSSVHGILQARTLEWVAISFSRVSSWPKDWTLISYIGRQILYHWATWEALWWDYSNTIPFSPPLSD